MSKYTRPALIISVLALALITSIVFFMFYNIKGSWQFILFLRGQKLLSLLLISYSIAVSTVLFQTVMQNRILTPSIIGFDAIFVLFQTIMSVTIGFMRTNHISPQLKFIVEVMFMFSSSLLLYRFFIKNGTRDLYFLALAGITFGGLLRGITAFLQRILNPTEFSVLQDKLFASFNLVNTNLLVISFLLITVVSVAGWRMRNTFDVLTLGKEVAINLGVNYTGTVKKILFIVAALVSVSTALVGPVTFFGLLVSNLAYTLIKDYHHKYLIPAATLLAMIFLVAGQTILERVFGYDSSLSIIIDFIGGITFIAMIIRSAK